MKVFVFFTRLITSPENKIKGSKKFLDTASLINNKSTCLGLVRTNKSIGLEKNDETGKVKCSE